MIIEHIIVDWRDIRIDIIHQYVYLSFMVVLIMFLFIEKLGMVL